MKSCKVTSIKSKGVRKTYNLTMKSKQHNYALYDAKDDANFVISKNSCCYAYMSYITAYLKANYVDEFLCAYLNVESKRKKHEKVETIEKDLKKFNIDLLDKDLNQCEVEYKIVKKSDIVSGDLKSKIRPGLLCKGVGEDAAEEIAKNKPYNNLKEFVFKNDSKKVNQKVVGSLALGGFFDDELREFLKTQKNKRNKSELLIEFSEYMMNKFQKIRQDRKASSKRGVGPETLFD